MARVALIKCSMPPQFNLLMTPPLGILSLAAVLRQNGHRVMVLDARFRPREHTWIREKLEVFSPDMVGLSAMTQEAESMDRLAAFSRTIPSVKLVVAGGPHPSAYPMETAGNTSIDCLVIGEGEETMLELVSRAERGEGIAGVPGTAARENGQVAYADPRPFIENIDQIPMPAWDLIDLDQYGRMKRMGNLPRRKYAALFTSRGCPYRCAYCHKLFGKQFRPRTADNILGEMEHLYRAYGVREFEIDDDIFNLDRERVFEVCGGIIARGLKVKLAFPNGLRGDLLDGEILRLLKAAGTYFIAMAVETASPRLQKLIEKNLDLERIVRVAAECRRLGITTLGFFMLGFPGETRQELDRTIDFAVRSPFDFASFFVVSPIRGTDLFRLAGEGPRIASAQDYQSLDYHQGRHNMSQLPDRDLYRRQRRAYLDFYVRRIPVFVSRGLWRRVSWTDGIKQFIGRISPTGLLRSGYSGAGDNRKQC